MMNWNFEGIYPMVTDVNLMQGILLKFLVAVSHLLKFVWLQAIISDICTYKPTFFIKYLESRYNSTPLADSEFL